MKRPLGARLEDRLQSIKSRLATLLRTVPVGHFANDFPGVVVMAPSYHYQSRRPEQQATLISLKREFDALSEILTVVLAGAPKETTHALKSANQSFRLWLEFGNNWGVSPDPVQNEAAMYKSTEGLQGILEILGFGSRQTIVVPDTNSIVDECDPVKYREIADAEEFTFLLLPTVLAELDDLKINHRNPEVREQAKRAIRRIKGWRQQGSLREGVRVDRTITISAFHREPKMSDSLSWLDSEVNDDRLIASVLEVQAESPSGSVVLVTGDINLQNKADVAFILTAEIEAA